MPKQIAPRCSEQKRKKIVFAIDVVSLYNPREKVLVRDRRHVRVSPMNEAHKNKLTTSPSRICIRDTPVLITLTMNRLSLHRLNSLART